MSSIPCDVSYYINAYLHNLTESGYSNNTIKAYWYALIQFKNLNIEEIKTADLMEILCSKYSSLNSIATRQATVKSFFKWLHDNEVIKINPAEGLGSVQKKESKPMPIPNKYIENIFKNIDKIPLTPKTFFYLLAELGIRIEEVLLLDVKDICWKENCVIIDNGNIPFSSCMNCYSLLKELSSCRKSGPLFITARNNRATYDWAYYWWKRVLKLAGLEGYTINQLRYSRQSCLREYT